MKYLYSNKISNSSTVFKSKVVNLIVSTKIKSTNI